ncbi:MAG TPA: inorganic phosphate transporter [Candidatus Acidoferrales bacterium]|jgi:PiT family inorganic phosphate transporter|nr:inorganic phosphate transporter [Candidatus Acidoferrales bacterium]
MSFSYNGTMQHFLGAPSLGTLVLLAGALLLAFSFETINGFHDTANAVATVIYTNTLKPWIAVVWSGIWNFTGVLLSSGAVAFTIVALLPVELVIHVGTGAGFAMVFALLFAALIWNFATWYVGIPASSSHTLIGSIVGVGLMNSFLNGRPFGDGVNWGKVHDTFAALLISPIIGFVAAGLLLLIMKFLIRNPKLYESPEGDTPPVWWIRILLVLTCTGVSYAHGSNDGQKGMGLIMLIMIGILPGIYAINPATSADQIAKMVATSHSVQAILDAKAGNATISAPEAEAALSDFLKSGAKAVDATFVALAYENRQISTIVSSAPTPSKLNDAQRKDLRTKVYLVGATITKMTKGGAIFTEPAQVALLNGYAKQLTAMTSYIPIWVKFAVALCLGIGTMIGWKRIVVTIGEKIGKAHLTYAQGASAEIVTWATIQSADVLGLPVSTTHILTSGVAGTMAANGSGLQAQTLRNIVLAWVLTVPVTVFLGAGLFAAGLEVVLRLFGVK